MLKGNGSIALYLIGCFIIVLGNLPLFWDGIGIRWDAVDNIWVFLRWYGSALHEGFFPDFFPYIFSGYPIGSDIQAGPYNIIYLLIAYAFPNSLLSINFIYLFTQFLIFTLGFGIGTSYRFSPITKLYLGLSLVASGYVIGHASHMSHLASAVGLLACFLGLRLAELNRMRFSFIVTFLGVYYQCTGGYVQDTLFGAICLSTYWVFQCYKASGIKWKLFVPVLGALLGLVLSFPAILHFYNLFSQSTRGDGLSIESALSGSMPLYSVLYLFHAPWLMNFSEPTLERFHLLTISGILLASSIGVIIYSKKDRKFLLPLFLLAIFITLLALGRHDILGIRAELANQFYIFRAGKYPSAEHRGVALFIFALITAFTLQWIVTKWPRVIFIILLLISGDFLYLKYHLSELQYSRAIIKSNSAIPSFKVVFYEQDQAMIDAPRNCDSLGAVDLGAAIDYQKNHLAPHSFYWAGYEGLLSKAYIENRAYDRQLICGPSRLKEPSSGRPIKYKLIEYSPSYIKILITDKNFLLPEKMIWADFDDGYWSLDVNGRHEIIHLSPSGMRGIVAKEGDTIEMRYRGPLSRFWR